MRSFYLVALFPLAAIAETNGHCSGTATGFWLSEGICEPTATCVHYGGAYITGGCPDDPEDVKCCLIGLETSDDTNPCGDYSFCGWTTNSICKSVFDGNFKTNFCPGGTDYKCCLANA